MEVVKKACTFFRRVGLQDDAKRNKASFQELPLEIVLFILRYVPTSQATLLRNECKLLRLAVAISIKDSLRNILHELRNRIINVRNKVVSIVMDHRIVHPGLLKSLLAWRNLQIDVSLLNVMISRYTNDMDVWCPLTNLLGPIVEEIKDEIKNLAQEEWKTTRKKVGHPHLDNFLKRFIDEIEVHFYESEMLVSFELRLIDLLFSCPCGNLKLVVNSDMKTYKRIEMYCELRTLKELSIKLAISDSNTRWQNEREILRFMRDYIRSVNIAHVQSLIKKIENYGKNIDDLAFSSELKEIISFISAGVESSVEHMEIPLGNGEVHEIFQNISTMDVAKNGLYCSFEVMNPCGQPTCLKGICSRPEMEGVCTACKHRTINNVFTLGITNGRSNGNYVRELLVIFEPEKDNYSMTTNKHLLT